DAWTSWLPTKRLSQAGDARGVDGILHAAVALGPRPDDDARGHREERWNRLRVDAAPDVDGRLGEDAADAGHVVRVRAAARRDAGDDHGIREPALHGVECGFLDRLGTERDAVLDEDVGPNLDRSVKQAPIAQRLRGAPFNDPLVKIGRAHV